MTETELGAQFLQSLPGYLTYTGILCQKDGDTGDSAQRMGTAHTLLSLIGDEKLTGAALHAGLGYPRQLETSWGMYARSDQKSFWGSDPRCTSRDQLSIVKMALSPKELLKVFVRQTLRLSLHQNYYDVLESRYHIPDPPILQELSVYARGLLGPLSYLITWFTDIGYGLDMALRNSTFLNIWSADNMLALGLLQACHKYPSPTAKLLMRFYKKTDFMKRLELYHEIANGNNGCLPLYYLFKVAFLKLENYEV